MAHSTSTAGLLVRVVVAFALTYVAQAYGEHPETALTRMRWALTAVASAFGGSPVEPAHAPAPGHFTMACTSRAA